MTPIAEKCCVDDPKIQCHDRKLRLKGENRPFETATEFRMQVTCKSSTNGFRAHGLKPRGRFRVLQTWISSLRVILAAVVYQSGLNNVKSEQFAKKKN